MVKEGKKNCQCQTDTPSFYRFGKQQGYVSIYLSAFAKFHLVKPVVQFRESNPIAKNYNLRSHNIHFVTSELSRLDNFLSGIRERCTGPGVQEKLRQAYFYPH